MALCVGIRTSVRLRARWVQSESTTGSLLEVRGQKILPASWCAGSSPYPSPRRCKSQSSAAPRARGRPRGAESQGTPDLAPGPWVTPAGPASRPPGLTREAASRARDGCGSVKLLEASPRRRLRSGDRGGPARSGSPSARTEEASGQPLTTGLHKRGPAPGAGPGPQFTGRQPSRRWLCRKPAG